MRKKIGMMTALAVLVMSLAGCGTTGPSSATNTSQSSGASGATVSDGTIKVEQLTMDLPEGFQSSTTPGLILSNDYPDDLSNIYVYCEDKYDDFDDMLRGRSDEYVAHMQEAYEEQYSERPEIEVICYEQSPIVGRNAYRIELSYTLQGIPYYQLEYVIDADKTYYVAFSQVGDHDYKSTFEGAVSTIAIK